MANLSRCAVLAFFGLFFALSATACNPRGEDTSSEDQAAKGGCGRKCAGGEAGSDAGAAGDSGVDAGLDSGGTGDGESGPSDASPPTQPTNLTIAVLSCSEVRLGWSISTDALD